MARFARHTKRSGGQKGRGLGGRNFCPPSLSAAAEFRVSETGTPPQLALIYHVCLTYTNGWIILNAILVQLKL
jgi:hypothetical protein